MEIKVNSFDADRKSVSVTFTQGEVVHTRDVNACLAEDGSYDEAATADRLEEVALGVAAKIGVSAIPAVMPALPVPDLVTESETPAPKKGSASKK